MKGEHFGQSVWKNTAPLEFLWFTITIAEFLLVATLKIHISKNSKEKQCDAGERKKKYYTKLSHGIINSETNLNVVYIIVH